MGARSISWSAGRSGNAFRLHASSAWLVQGVVLLPLSALCWFWADFSLAQFMWGVTRPLAHYAPLWLLPGLAALGGVAAIVIGIGFTRPT